MKNFTILKAIFCLAILLTFKPANSQPPTLLSVTTNGNTTTQLIQITGSGGVPTNNKGLELYTSISGSGDGFVQAFDRSITPNVPTNLHLQGNGGNTYINESGGNVGIGTTSPNQKLHLDGGANSTYLKVSGNTGYILVGASLNFNSFYSRNNSDAAKDLQFIMGSTTAATILANGNFLIAKTSQANSTYKLDVNGSVRANKIVVNTTGADFVFNPEYKLPSLASVETYIKQHKHLPDINSATQMHNNGLDVGEMNTKLLQKVEELTLYMIELKKENDKLQKEVESIKRNRSNN